MTWPTTKSGDYLVLRTVSKDWTSRDEFKWRRRGETVAPDWDPDPGRDCGGGLHGLLWGCGDATLLSGASDAVWMVVAVKPGDVANPDAPDEVRFRAGRVIRHGTRDDVIAFLVSHGTNLPIVYAHTTAGDGGTATAGDGGTATAGYRGTATAGDWGTATAGDGGTATAGHNGTATAGYRGTATAGDWGTATAGYRGTATAGDGGVLRIAWWGGARIRWAIGYIGEDGIKANVPYRCDDRGRLVRAS